MSSTAARMWNRYCQLRAEAVLRDHLGLSPEEWDGQPVEFLAWADQFHRLVAAHGRDDPGERQTRAELRKMIGG